MKVSYIGIALLLMVIGCNDDFSDPSEAPRLSGFRDASVALPPSSSSTNNGQASASNSWNQPPNSSNERANTNNTPESDTEDDNNTSESSTENDGNDAEPEGSSSSNAPSSPQSQQGDSPDNGSSNGEPTSTDEDTEDDSENEQDMEPPVSNEPVGQDSNADMEQMPADNEQGDGLDNEPGDNLVGSIQDGIDASCVSAGCHATQNNLRSLEDIQALIGQNPYGSGTPYIVPGNKEASYLYNVLLPPNERNIGINGGQMPPPYRPISLRRTPLQLRTLRDDIGRWIDGLEP